LVFPGLLQKFVGATVERIKGVHRPRSLDWYKQGWKASDFFYNSPGQPKVDINPNLRFIHSILSPLLCGLLSSIMGSPVKMLQGNVCMYSSKTNRCLENHHDGCPFSAIVHLFSTDPNNSGLHIQRNGKFETVSFPGAGDVVLIQGDKFLHRSCEVKGDNERMVIVFFLEYSNPKDAKRAALDVTALPEQKHLKRPQSTGRSSPKREQRRRQIDTTTSSSGKKSLPRLGTSGLTKPQEMMLKSSSKKRGKKLRVNVDKGKGVNAKSSTCSSGGESMSSEGKRGMRRKRQGYVLEEADRLHRQSKADFASEKEMQRAKRRRKRILRMQKMLKR